MQGNSTGIVNPDNSEVSETEDTQSVLEDYSTADGHIMNSKIIFAENTEAVQPYIDAAELRKEQIRNSPTTIVKADEFLPGETYSGTAYFHRSMVMTIMMVYRRMQLFRQHRNIIRYEIPYSPVMQYFLNEEVYSDWRIQMNMEAPELPS